MVENMIFKSLKLQEFKNRIIIIYFILFRKLIIFKVKKL